MIVSRVVKMVDWNRIFHLGITRGKTRRLQTNTSKASDGKLHREKNGRILQRSTQGVSSVVISTK